MKSETVGCGSASPGSCQTCPAGYRKTSEFTCEQCPQGTFEHGNMQCMKCTPGRYSSAAATSCTSCAQGDYVGHHSASSCTQYGDVIVS